MSTRGTFKAGSVSVSHNILSTSFDTWCHCWQYPSLPMLPLIQVFKYAVKLFANCWELAVGGWSVPEGHFKGKICESTVACLDKKCLKWAHFLMFFWSQTDSSWGNVVSRTNHAAASVLSFLEKMYWSLGETLPHESLVYVLWKLSFMYFASFPPIIIFGTSFQGWKFMILESHWQLNQKGRDFYNCFWTLHWKVTCRNQCWTLGLIGSSADTFLLAPILICTTSMSAFKLQRTWKYLLHQHFTGCWSLAGGKSSEPALSLHDLSEAEGKDTPFPGCVRACTKFGPTYETFDWSVFGQVHVLVLPNQGQTWHGHLNSHHRQHGPWKVCCATLLGQSHTKRCCKS